MKKIITISSVIALLFAVDVQGQNQGAPTPQQGPAHYCEGVKVFLQKQPYSKYPSVSNAPYSIMDAYSYDQQVITDVIKRVADYQIAKYGANIPIQDWLVGTFYSSFVAAYNATGDKWYYDQAYKWSKDSKWDVKKILNADDLCPAQTYLDLYFVNKERSIYKGIDKRLKEYFTRTEILPGEIHSYDKKSKPFTGRNIWSWCDALYMAPPVYARMGAATGDERYFEMLHRLYWDTVDFLYSPEDKLFFRNNKSQNEKLRTPNNKRVFWGRGNGWVIGGLARVLEYLPKSDAMYNKYLELFQDLSYSVASYQMEDGMWRSCINDPEWYPLKETSGSAFYVYAIAKGVNDGLLPRDYFMPVILKGWSGLLSCVTPEGKLGYSQIVAGSPHEVRPEDNKDYATGAFILAAAEMLKLKPAEELAKIEARKFSPRLVAKDGAWTWYNDERVIFHNNIFYASYVKRNGDVAFTAYSIEKWASCHAQKESILSTWRESDDHDNAAFIPLKNGNVLAAYATHGKTKSSFMREIKAGRWKECEMTQEMEYPIESGLKGITYQNLHRLSSEGDRIYNFTRGINFNPTMTYSDDDGKSWSDPIQIIVAGTNSNRRPYVKYVSNGVDRIDLFYTDGHPRNVKTNSVYHLYYSKGSIYKSDGKLIRSIEQIKSIPLKVTDGTRIFDGSTEHGRGWVYDLEYDAKGQPYGAFAAAPSGDIGSDMRYWIAKFDGSQWSTEQIAYAGSNIYPIEQHYAGGIALHPKGDDIVLSANVNPKNGEPLPNGKYQLFKATKNEDKWEFTQLTYDPVFHHLRPVIERSNYNALFWFTCNYKSFQNYHCDIMMSYEY